MKTAMPAGVFLRVSFERAEAEVAESGPHKAAIIYRLRARGGLLELMIAELFLTGPEAVRVAVRLLRQVGRQSRAHYGVAIAGPETLEAKALTKAGYLRVPGVGPTLTVRRLDDQSAQLDLVNWTSWRLTIGDLEIF